MKPISTIALKADRFDISNRAAAAISTAALIDFGVVSAENRSHIIDFSKVSRARQKLRKNFRKDEVFLQNDCWKTTTFCWKTTTRKEDHYVLVGEPELVYLDHITLERGTGIEIADGLYKYVKNEMSFGDKLRTIGADSTAVNTGNKNGAIRLLECHLKQALHWFTCSLHVNEFPLRQLCKKLIGPTESSSQWKGALGKSLETCEALSLPSKDIQRISGGPSLSELDVKDLGHDEAYLCKIIKAIQSGVIDKTLLREKPGPMSHARWLTTACRICRLFISQDQPCEELHLLTPFVACHYGPIWFSIKSNSWCTDGWKHFLEMIKLMQRLPTAIKAVVWPVMQCNAYWTHNENVLLALLADPDTCNRELGIKRITTIRQASQSSNQDVKRFRVPKVHHKKQNLKDLLPPMERSLTEPPLIKEISTEELNKFAKNPLTIKIPCHSQMWSAALKWLQKLLRKFIIKIPGMVTSGLKSNLVT